MRHTILLLFLLFTSISRAGEALPLRVVTEELAPLQIDNVPGKPTGAAVEIVELMLKKSGYETPIEIFPWARSYSIATNRPNTLIFSIIRAPHREQDFHWIGSIYSSNVYLVKSASRKDLNIETLNDAQKYRVGINRSDLSQHYLKEKGFTEGKNMLINSSYERLWRLLFEEKVDFILANDFMWLTREQDKLKISKPLSIALPLPDYSSDYYIAVSKGTSQKVISRLKMSLANMKKNGEYHSILAKWHLVTK